jgi:hypothetical protein
MHLPGFTAEAALQAETHNYYGAPHETGGEGNRVAPQAFVPIPSPFHVSWNVYCSEGTCFIVDQFGNRHNISFSNV